MYCYYKDNGKNIVFEKPEGNVIYIDIKDHDEREKFVKKVSDSEGGGLSAKDGINDYNEAFLWVVNSKLPLVLSEKYSITRIETVSSTASKIGDEIQFTPPEQVLRMVKDNSKRFVEYSNEVENILIEKHNFKLENIKDDYSISISIFSGYYEDIPAEVTVDFIIKEKQDE